MLNVRRVFSPVLPLVVAFSWSGGNLAHATTDSSLRAFPDQQARLYAEKPAHRIAVVEVHETPTPSPIRLPESVILIGIGLIGLVGLARREQDAEKNVSLSLKIAAQGTAEVRLRPVSKRKSWAPDSRSQRNSKGPRSVARYNEGRSPSHG